MIIRRIVIANSGVLQQEKDRQQGEAEGGKAPTADDDEIDPSDSSDENDDPDQSPPNTTQPTTQRSKLQERL